MQGAACLHLRVHLTPRISLTSTLYVYVYCRDMPTRIRRLPPRAWPDLYPDPGTLRVGLDLTQAELATSLGVTVNTWARWERGELAIHPGYQLLLDCVEHHADRNTDRTAARLRAPGGVRNLW